MFKATFEHLLKEIDGVMISRASTMSFLRLITFALRRPGRMSLQLHEGCAGGGSHPLVYETLSQIHQGGCAEKIDRITYDAIQKQLNKVLEAHNR
jgi:hypothetical protein